MLADPEKLAAALEQLETERQRRIEERVEKGEAVRVPPLSVVVGHPESVAAAIEAFKARLREGGEAREIIFDEPAVLITGVPRHGRDQSAL
jgi:hypothetical protein